MIPRKERERRRTLIRNAILGLARRYPWPEVALIACLDLFTLLLQKWVVLVVWKRKGPAYEPVVSTLCDPLLRQQYKYPRASPSAQFAPWRPGHAVTKRFNAIDLLPETAGEVLLTVGRFSKGKVILDRESTDTIADLLDDQSFWSEVRTEFTRIFGEVRHFQRQPGAFRPSQAQFEGHSVGEMYKSLRATLNAFLESKVDSPFLSYGSGAFGFPKLHFCLKWGFLSKPRHKKWPYTARLIIPPVQARMLGRWANDESVLNAFARRRGANRNRTPLFKRFINLVRSTPSEQREDNLIALLETPLNAKSRAIADSSFASGCVDFGHQPGDDLDMAESEADMLRQEAEAFMYWSCQYAEDDQRAVVGANVLFIPIHVNGAPWLNVYSFSSQDREDGPAWNHNYLLYRDLLPEIGGQVRKQMVASYLEVISGLLRKTVNCRREDMSHCLLTVNAEFERLAVFCPMPQLVLSDTLPHDKEKAASDLVFIPALGSDIRLSILVNRLYPPHVDVSMLHPSQLLDYCKRTLTSETSVRNILANRSLAYNTHLLATPLRALETHLDDGDIATAHKLVRRLNALRLYATALVDTNKKIGSPRIVSIASLFEWTEALLREALAAANVTFDRRNRCAIKAESSAHKVVYHAAYVEAALTTAMENAVEHGVDKTEITAVLKSNPMSPGMPGVGLLSIFLTNHVDCPIASLRKRINTLNNPQPNHIGVITLRLGADVYMKHGSMVRYSLQQSKSGNIHEVTLEIPIAQYANPKSSHS